MAHTPLFPVGAQKNAYIRDDALILYFEAAETPLVARFDLSSLVQANFEVAKKAEMFVLVLRDFAGERQEITTFANKADAHQALYSILQALLSYGEAKKTETSSPKLVWKFVKGLLIGFVIAVAVAAALMWFSTPVNRGAQNNAAQTTAVPSAVEEEQQEQMPAETPQAPDGEPMSMEDFVAPSLTPSAQ